MEKNFTRKVGYRKIVRRWLLQGVIAMVFCGVAVAHGKYAQLLEKKVTLKFVDAPLEVVLHAIEQQAGIRFFYSRDRVDLDEQVSVQAEDKLLKDVFRELFGSLRIRYFIHDKESTVTLKRQKQGEETGQGVPEDRNIQLAPAAVRVTSVSGVVTDAQSQQPLAGVNVVVKGTLRGTSTDADGRYSIEVDDDKDILVFSFIGFKTVEVPVGGRTIIDTSLEEDISRLSEVTVSTGYWEVDKKYSTGNISKVTSKEIENQPVNNPILALQGRVAGLNIEQVSGVPGGSFRNLQIRGQNSLRADGNDPLFVIDGVPFPSQNLSNRSAGDIYPTPLNILNPADIESIEILKDADATAIYGSLGANGVVLITTKQAKQKETVVDFNFYRGAGRVSNRIDLLSTQQYLEMRNEAFANDQVNPDMNNAPDLVRWEPTRYTDWQKELIGGTAQITNLHLSLSGGSARTRLLASGGFFKETAVFPGYFPYLKGSMNLGASHKSQNDKLELSFKSNVTLENSSLPISDLTKDALTLPPNAPAAFNEDGSLNWEGGTWNNPYASLMKDYESKNKNFLANLNLNYEIFPGLTVKTNAGLNFLQNDIRESTPIASYSPVSVPLGESRLSDNSVETWIIEPQINYRKVVGKASLDLLIGSTFRETVTKGILIKATGFANDVQLNNLLAAQNIDFVWDKYSEYRYSAGYARVGFNWDEKYFVNLSGRRDGSSRFGPENRLANFGAAGISWIFSKEKFFSLVPLSFGKLRASYGTIGNDQIGDYEYLSTYRTEAAFYQNNASLTLIRPGNPAYQWERVNKLEVGLELGFINDRVKVNASYYRNRSSNQLIQYPLPGATGFSSITANLDAIVENRGFEAEVSSSNVDSRDFKWTTSFNLTIPRNELIQFPNLEGSPYATAYRIGEPLYIELLYQYLRINDEGMYTLADLNGDGVVSMPNDNQIIVDKSRRYYGGMVNTLRYKGFSLEFLFQFLSQINRDYRDVFTEAPGRRSNQPTEVLNRWRNPGDITEVQKFTTGGAAYYAYDQYRLSDVIFTNASFIRLKNISLTYQFPTALVNKMSMQNFSIYVQGQNLLTFTKYEFLDPETRGSLPPIKMMTIGMNLTF